MGKFVYAEQHRVSHSIDMGSVSITNSALQACLAIDVLHVAFRSLLQAQLLGNLVFSNKLFTLSSTSVSPCGKEFIERYVRECNSSPGNV